MGEEGTGKMEGNMYVLVVGTREENTREGRNRDGRDGRDKHGCEGKGLYHWAKTCKLRLVTHYFSIILLGHEI